MKRLSWRFVEHQPEWIPAPYKINRAGDTKPGFLCIHELENGKGLCASTWMEESTTPHVCLVAFRGWPNISRPCYDKYRRCPGWAGGGWKYPQNQLCHTDYNSSGYLDVDYEDRWWKWKTHKCPNCGVVVLPYMVRYTSPRAVWYRLRSMLWRWP